MKRILATLLCVVAINTVNAQDPKKCNWQDADGNSHKGTVASMTNTWEEKNGAGRSTNSSNSVTGHLKGDLVVVSGSTDATETNSSSRSSSTERNSTVSVTRDVCMDSDNNYESVNWNTGW